MLAVAANVLPLGAVGAKKAKSLTNKIIIMTQNNNQINPDAQSLQMAVMRCCSFCQHFQHEEVGDSDYGAVYAEKPSCMKYIDTDEETEEEIPNFDRNIVRDCCELDFWKVLDKDNDLIDLLNQECGEMDKAYELFKTRYNNA